MSYKLNLWKLNYQKAIDDVDMPKSSGQGKESE